MGSGTAMIKKASRHRCPICGQPNLTKPAYNGPANEISPGSQEICLCCHFQFGYDDDAVGHTFADWRNQWVADGMPWRGSTKTPKDYTPQEQLKHIDLNLVRFRFENP